jgi:hypothetical protein
VDFGLHAALPSPAPRLVFPRPAPVQGDCQRLMVYGKSNGMSKQRARERRHRLQQETAEGIGGGDRDGICGKLEVIQQRKAAIAGMQATKLFYPQRGRLMSTPRHRLPEVQARPASLRDAWVQAHARAEALADKISRFSFLWWLG